MNRWRGHVHRRAQTNRRAVTPHYQNHSVLVVEHDMQFVEDIADRVTVDAPG